MHAAVAWDNAASADVTMPHSTFSSSASRALAFSISSSMLTWNWDACSIAAITSGSVLEPPLMVSVAVVLMNGRTPSLMYTSGLAVVAGAAEPTGSPAVKAAAPPAVKTSRRLMPFRLCFFSGCFTVDSPMILVVKLAYRISDLDNVRTFGCTVVDARDILLFAGL